MHLKALRKKFLLSISLCWFEHKLLLFLKWFVKEGYFIYSDHLLILLVELLNLKIVQS